MAAKIYPVLVVLCLIVIVSVQLWITPNITKECLTPSSLEQQPNNVVAKSTEAPKSDLAAAALQLSRAHGEKSALEYGVTEIVTTGEHGETCDCELVSIDCLDSIKCIPNTEKRSQELISLGVTTRVLMKEAATFSGDKDYMGHFPIGKTVQYNAMQVWKQWMEGNVLPLRFSSIKALFVNHTRYPFCKKNKLVGWGCVFAGYTAEEQMAKMESEALVASPVSPDTVTAARIDLMAFHSHKLGADTNATSAPPALGHLLTFSHIMLMGVNLRPFVQEIYDKYHSVISHDSSKESNRLRVSLHMRRADSCDHKQGGYEKSASKLDSIAQTSGKRMCYNTSVYMDGLRRVQRLSGRPLDVYLSTDYAGSVMSEIEQDFKKDYKEMNWHFLNFSRDAFVYDGFVESHAHNNHGDLGETAIADLWHLSHGQVFVGHMGSRFCKVGWALATARHNTFVPFRTVDGHSFCCEIDEQCAQTKPYVDSMENCMTFSHELLGKKHEDYWGVGSQMRKIMYELKHNKTETEKK